MKGLICMCTGFGHDPEVPAGYQDADIEMAELAEAAREANEREETHKEWERDATSFDDQDLTTLIELVSEAQAKEIARSVFVGNDRPSTRMVSLKSLEMRLIAMRDKLNKLTGEEQHDRDERARYEAFSAYDQTE